MNEVLKKEKKFKEFLWENKIIEWGFFIDICPTGSSKEILGIGIKFSLNNRKIKIHENKKKEYSSLFLTLVSWTSKTIKINEKEIKENEKWEDMINLFKKINNLDYFEKEIELDEESITYIEYCSPYLISPYKPDQYYMDKNL